LALPGLPPLTLGPGTVQNVTQQASDQSQTADGQTADPSPTVADGQAAGSSPMDEGGTAGQAQVAAQSNATVQVAFGATGAGAGPTAVNQTAQGIWQVRSDACSIAPAPSSFSRPRSPTRRCRPSAAQGAANATEPSAVDTVIRSSGPDRLPVLVL
jgi:hypothetical protein